MNKKAYPAHKEWQRTLTFRNTAPFDAKWSHLSPSNGEYTIKIFIGVRYEYNKAPDIGLELCTKYKKKRFGDTFDWDPREDKNNSGFQDSYINRDRRRFVFWEGAPEFRWLMPLCDNTYGIHPMTKYMIQEFMDDARRNWIREVKSKVDMGERQAYVTPHNPTLDF